NISQIDADLVPLETKCQENSGKDSHVKSQNAVASVLGISQRQQVKLALSDDNLTKYDYEDLRHYAIMITTNFFSIWHITVMGIGYEMRRAAQRDLSVTNKAKKYIKWWNVIHVWGLGPYADSFQNVLEDLWKKRGKPSIRYEEHDEESNNADDNVATMLTPTLHKA
ncbi:hypothetical protein MMC14_001793, partial [Varicellaria rhodocarpa]|nr:hypothetical protein [Varicellaria rhodocarpa]